MPLQVDAPDDGRPSEVLYLLLQRAQANVEVRAHIRQAAAAIRGRCEES